MRTAVALLAAVAMLVACAPTAQHPVPGGPPFRDDEVRFTAPTGWHVKASTGVSYGPSWPIRYLSNQALRDDCLTDAIGVTCQSPIDGELPDDGMLVAWFGRTCVAKGCDLPLGALMSIGNRNGVLAAVTEGCEDVGYTERSAYYVTVGPQRIDGLLVCAVHPSDVTREAFLGFLDAIRWRIP